LSENGNKNWIGKRALKGPGLPLAEEKNEEKEL